MQNEKVPAAMQDNVTQAASVERELRLDAKAFRENSIWNQDGDEIRLTKTADRLDAAADFIASKSEAVQTLAEAWSKRTGSTEVTGEAVPYLKVYFDSKDEVRAFNDAIRALAAHRESQP